jgi:hypothetical protein
MIPQKAPAPKNVRTRWFARGLQAGRLRNYRVSEKKVDLFVFRDLDNAGLIMLFEMPVHAPDRVCQTLAVVPPSVEDIDTIFNDADLFGCHQPSVPGQISSSGGRCRTTKPDPSDFL